MCGPRSLRIRMWIGFWPPSWPTFFFEPERAPAPFWPRPEVLPKPEPSPRPIRFLRWREPGFGFRLCSPISSALISSAILDLHEVCDARDHPAQGLVVLLLGDAADLAQVQRTQRVALLGVCAVGRLDLLDLDRGHQMCPSGSSAAGSAETRAGSGGLDAASTCGGSPFSRFGSRPSTSAIVRPRSSATCFGSRRSIRPCIVAFTRLIGFWEPSDF